VSPEQIGIVIRTWDRVGQEPGRLQDAVAAGLPGPGAEAQARWVVEAVGRLSSALDHPTALPPAAAAAMAERAPATTAEIALDCEALVAALRELAGDFGPEQEQAWDAALRLFEELIGPLCLDPFRTRHRLRSTP
jgi:hypothetical protein